MSEYVSEGLKIEYSVPIGLVSMLSSVSKKPQKDIWCHLSEVANICANRLVNKKNQEHSWTSKNFPDTEIALRVDMYKTTHWQSKKMSFKCEIRLGKTKFECFTQEQINEHITESILLDVDN